MSINPARLIRLAESRFADTERSNQESQWELISEFIMPNQSSGFVGMATPGEKKTRRLYDSMPIQANQDLAAAIHATLTNPATKWSKLRFRDEELNNDEEAVEWLEKANNAIHVHFNESNFDTQVSKNYQSYTALGNMVLFHEEAPRESPELFKGFQFNAWHLSQVVFSENNQGIVDTVYRRFEMTLRQVVERWGPESLTQDQRKQFQEDPEKCIKILFCIFPRDPKEVRLNEFGLAPAAHRPFASVYIRMDEAEILEEDGYYEFPAYVTRWQSFPGEVYGRGPGHIALPDVRTLNTLTELHLQVVSKATNPPILANQRGILGSLDLRPGRLTVVRDIQGIRELVPQARVDWTQFSVQNLQEKIKSIFFLDKLFLPPRTETGEMTAFEVSERLAQVQRVLGPTLARLNSEFLSPLIIRAFKMLLRAGVLSPIPDILQERGIDVEIAFVNQLARSQQIEDLGNIQGWVQGLAFLAQLKPEVVDNIDSDGIARHTAKVFGVPEASVTNDEDVRAIREQRAQQAQQQQAIQAAQTAAEVASKTGLNNGGNNAE